MLSMIETIEMPQITEMTPQHYAYLHLVVPAKDIRSAMGPGLKEVYDAVQAQGMKPAGAWFAHHLKRPNEFFDFEICVPVASPIEPVGRIKAGEIPPVKVARTVYRGNYSGLPGAWGEFMAWIQENKLPEAQDLWERYLVSPDTTNNPEEWQTEMNKPLLG
jgi:effector-binding domain-containing protein